MLHYHTTDGGDHDADYGQGYWRCPRLQGRLVLATAVSTSIAHLGTGDTQVLAVGHDQGVTIGSPREVLDLLNREESDG